jgi:ribosome biogenesis GTPase A
VGVSEVLKACQQVNILKNGVSVDWKSLIETTEKRILAQEIKDQKKSQDVDESSFLGRSRRRQRMPDSEDSLAFSDSQLSIGSDEESEDDDDEDDDLSKIPVHSLSLEPELAVHSKWITIGTLGHPNVGKSSLINSILGKKVVSVSKTPGHTKHFQTIVLSDGIRLCDCPGLVFPALIPKPIQILSGMYRIAQVQEPYTAVTYLAERIPIVQILNLKHPDEEEPGFSWSGWSICEAFALQRGFLTPKVARPDVYRAANMILRMANDGRLLLIFKPPKQEN